MGVKSQGQRRSIECGRESWDCSRGCDCRRTWTGRGMRARLAAARNLKWRIQDPGLGIQDSGVRPALG